MAGNLGIARPTGEIEKKLHIKNLKVSKRFSTYTTRFHEIVSNNSDSIVVVLVVVGLIGTVREGELGGKVENRLSISKILMK